MIRWSIDIEGLQEEIGERNGCEKFVLIYGEGSEAGPQGTRDNAIAFTFRGFLVVHLNDCGLSAAISRAVH
jgi:hypothetical protein